MQEQRAPTKFNLALLRIKRDVLTDIRDSILNDITKLETHFLSEPTHLRCGSAKYVNFEDLPLLPGE